MALVCVFWVISEVEGHSAFFFFFFKNEIFSTLERFSKCVLGGFSTVSLGDFFSTKPCFLLDYRMFLGALIDYAAARGTEIGDGDSGEILKEPEPQARFRI